MKNYLVWFVQNSSRKYLMLADSRKSAIKNFAQLNNVEVSGYIKCKILNPHKDFLNIDYIKEV